MEKRTGRNRIAGRTRKARMGSTKRTRGEGISTQGTRDRIAKTTVKYSQNNKPASDSHFDITKHISMVPLFQEREVDKYFLHFEKFAANCHWPKDSWTLLLQSVLIGKEEVISVHYPSCSFPGPCKKDTSGIGHKVYRQTNWTFLIFF